MKPDETDTLKTESAAEGTPDLRSRLSGWMQSAPWISLPLIGLAAFALLRLLAVVAVHPAWASGLTATALTLCLLAAKSLSVGAEATRQTVRESWQKLSDWLAVTSWKRLLAVGLCALIASAVISDSLAGGRDLAGLMFGLLIALVAVKLALPPKAAEAQAGTEQADPGASGDTANGNWLQRITWPRLLLVGLLLLIAAGIAESLFDPSDRPATTVTHTTARSSVSASAPLAAASNSITEDANADDEESAQAAPEAPEAPSAPTTGKKADVKIGPSGINIIERDADGRIKSHVQIGQGGITINKDKGEGKVEIRTPELANLPGMTPERARALEEKIRAKVEAKIEESSDKVSNSERGFNIASLAFLAIVSLAIMKLLAGGKRRAEQDAGSARIAADLARLEREAADAKLHAMQAQIEPHFLFNTLASVDQLIRTDPQRASQVQKTLIQYLRAAIPQMRDDAQRSTLGRQASMSRAYLEIMQVRMEERLEFSLVVPEGILCAEFPSMMLQTLIENSIKHGLEPKPEGGRIDVLAEIARGKLRVRVADTGAGFTADAQDGVGLSNIRERLRLLYGNSATLTLSPNEGGGTIAVIEIPYRDDEGQQTKAC
ncbi:sensor histidine kinase [Niveibacterium terrae]|uniref:sensor histidine kinase n=1 Tax=Niveibacterium terrae TaxID=3373598 RepID=UPI003A950B04